ncbi:MAG: hypothetical protein OEZ59_12075 [Deltaproteobacteria bacterium]|nr:hypothetical protein [Deltaproteobacteria bacterium]
MPANENIQVESVNAFPVKVMGGVFHVNEVYSNQGHSAQALVREIKEMNEDRWFVMASDEDSNHIDILAIIDDDLEFRIYARGILEQD